MGRTYFIITSNGKIVGTSDGKMSKQDVLNDFKSYENVDVHEVSEQEYTQKEDKHGQSYK